MKPLTEIELKVRDNYEQISVIFEEVLNLMLQGKYKGKFRDQGLCSRLKETTYQFFPAGKLFYSVIVPWFTPDRFNIEYLYLYYREPTIMDRFTLITRNDFEKAWYQVKLDKVPEPYIIRCFWFPVEKVYEQNRIEILRSALNRLENTKA